MDERLTGQRRLEASEQISEVYVHDSERGVRLARELAALFEDGRSALADPITALLFGDWKMPMPNPAGAITNMIIHMGESARSSCMAR